MSVQSLAQETVWGKQESVMKNAYKSVHFRYMMQDILQTSSESCLVHCSSWTQAKQIIVQRCAPVQSRYDAISNQHTPKPSMANICVSNNFLQRGTWVQQGWVSLCHSTECPVPWWDLQSFRSALYARCSIINLSEGSKTHRNTRNSEEQSLVILLTSTI